MKTIGQYLKSKTVQGILGLVLLGIHHNYHLNLIDTQTEGLLATLFTGWLGIGIRNAIKPISTPPTE